jgi:hypothetical protein
MFNGIFKKRVQKKSGHLLKGALKIDCEISILKQNCLIDYLFSNNLKNWSN